MPRFSLSGVTRTRPSDEVVGNEAFRVLRTNLEIALLDLEVPTIIVTSPHSGEGKTATCAQLARSFAEAGRRVVVVDLDMRHPDLHNWFGADNSRGASDVLNERCRLEEAVRYVEVQSLSGKTIHGLNLLSAGTSVPNPTELLGDERTARMINALSHQADLVLIDTPPVLPVADTLVIARLAAGALLVVDDDTALDSARAVKDALTRNRAQVLGVVLNRFEPLGGYYGYGEHPGEE